MKENKVLAPIQNLNNNREKDTKITVSKSCQLGVDHLTLEGGGG